MLRLALLLALLLLAPPASAQLIANCPTYNTTALSTNASSVISSCTLKTGYKDQLYVHAEGEALCGSTSTASLSLFLVTSKPKLGASFVGSIAPGTPDVLTVTSMVTPPGFIIEATELLSDANSGAAGGIPINANGSTVSVGAQIDGTPGGIGHYNLSSTGVTVASETMWALFNYAGKPPSSLQITTRILELTACTNGKTYIASVLGNEAAGFSPNATVWIILGLTTEKNTGPTPMSGSFNNGQITVFTTAPPPTTGGLIQ